jgi:cell division protein FtsI/penicillin-binding protein 2
LTGGRPARAHARVAGGRARVLFWIATALALFLVWRLFEIQVVDGPKLAHKADLQHRETSHVIPRRGTIYDRAGVALVRSLPSQSIYADTPEVGNPGLTARALAPVLGRSAEDILVQLRDDPSYQLLARKVSRDVALRVDSLKLPGIRIDPEFSGVRYVVSGRLASTAIGFTGTDENGLEGIEYAYDSLLRGTPGKLATETDLGGRSMPFAQPRIVEVAKPGHSLQLTLDSSLQFTCEQVLRETVRKFSARSGSAIVMDPQTGEILALANAPDYDLRDFRHASPDARRDRAVMDLYEPGSTFKLITAAAALEKGISPKARFAARDALPIGGHVIHNAEDGFMAGTGGTESIEDIIAYSHNVGAAELGIATGRAQLYKTIRAFGFGEKTNSGLPGESAGLVPAPADWSGTSLPTIAFGHGISTTPLGLLRAYAAIANGGILVRPRILSAILDADGRVVYRYGREVERRAISERTAAELRRYLRAVVVRGTGNPTARVEGYTTAGKTGTAQIAENGYYLSGAYVASFVGMIPAEMPKFVILVKIERPRGAIYGSVVAAPAFAKIARAAMLNAGILPSETSRLVRAGPASKREL